MESIFLRHLITGEEIFKCRNLISSKTKDACLLGAVHMRLASPANRADLCHENVFSLRYRDYFMVDECVRFLFTSCEGSLNERVSAANE